jgi:hypothetical protein
MAGKGYFEQGDPGSAAFWGAGGYDDYLNELKLAQLQDKGKERAYPKNVGEGIFSASENLREGYEQKLARDRIAAARLEYMKRRGEIAAGAPADTNIPNTPPVPGSRVLRPEASTTYTPDTSPDTTPDTTPDTSPDTTTSAAPDKTDVTLDLTRGGNYSEVPIRPATEEELAARSPFIAPGAASVPQQTGDLPPDAFDPNSIAARPPRPPGRNGITRALMGPATVPYASIMNAISGGPPMDPTLAAGGMVGPQPGPLARSDSLGGPEGNGTAIPGASPGNRPIRLASLAPGGGMDGGTMTDAAPPNLLAGATAQNAPPRNPVITSDIQPAPPSMFSPEALGGPLRGFQSPQGAPGAAGAAQARPVPTQRILGPAGPDPTAIQKAPDLLPSQRPLPLPIPEVMTHPGPEPPSGIVPPSDAMRYWAKIMNNPSVDPSLQKHAADEYARGEHFRALQQAQMEKAHDEWTRKADAWDKFQMEAPTRAIKQAVDLHGVENVRADLEKKYYEAGIPREQARVKANLDILESQQKIFGPVKTELRGTVYQRQPYLPPGTQIPGGGVAGQQPDTGYQLAPGAPPPKEEPISEMEGKAKVFADRAGPEIRRLRELNNGKALTYFKDDKLMANVPFVSNKLVSDEYRTAKNSFMNFGTELMTYLSGASYGEKEMQRTLAPFMPTYGDTDRDLADKMQRAETMIKSVRYMLPADARTMLEQENFDYGAKQPIVRGLSTDKINELGPGRRYIAPDGTPRQVPVERIRVK